jgi:hypothetical protein
MERYQALTFAMAGIALAVFGLAVAVVGSSPTVSLGMNPSGYHLVGLFAAGGGAIVALIVALRFRDKPAGF